MSKAPTLLMFLLWIGFCSAMQDGIIFVPGNRVEEAGNPQFPKLSDWEGFRKSFSKSSTPLLENEHRLHFQGLAARLVYGFEADCGEFCKDVRTLCKDCWQFLHTVCCWPRLLLKRKNEKS